MYLVQIMLDLVLLGFLLSQSGIAQQCYHPDGNLSGSSVPCNATLSDGSACCAPGDICTDVGYCAGHGGFFYRGGCTDPTWNAPACASQCLGVSDTYANLLYCGKDSPNTKWCCDDHSGADCCDDPKPDWMTVVNFGTYFYHPQNASASSAVSAPPSATSPSNAATSHTKTPPDTTSGGVSLHSPTASQAQPKPKTSGDSSMTTTMGLAVGAPLGLLAISITAFLVWRERRKASRLKPESIKEEWSSQASNPDEVMEENRTYGKGGPKIGWHELTPRTRPHELPHWARPHELDPDRPFRSELDAQPQRI